MLEKAVTAMERQYATLPILIRSLGIVGRYFLGTEATITATAKEKGLGGSPAAAAQTENRNTDADRCNLGSDHCWRSILSHAPICFQSTSIPCRMRQWESRLSFTCSSFHHNQWGRSGCSGANRDQRSVSSPLAHPLHQWRNTCRARPKQNFHIG